jgi:hypothetical protein
LSSGCAVEVMEVRRGRSSLLVLRRPRKLSTCTFMRALGWERREERYEASRDCRPTITDSCCTREGEGEGDVGYGRRVGRGEKGRRKQEIQYGEKVRRYSGSISGEGEKVACQS